MRAMSPRWISGAGGVTSNGPLTEERREVEGDEGGV